MLNFFIASFIIIWVLPVYAWEQNSNRRAFNNKQKNYAWKKAKGKCELCRVRLDPHPGEPTSVEYDHKVSFKDGGKTVQSNCGCVCRSCNRRKGKKSFLY